jgi:hypothetical protein
MRVLLFLLFPIFLSAQITRSYGVIEIGGFPISSTTGPKFAYNPADSSFYRWRSGSTWVKVIEPSIISAGWGIIKTGLTYLVDSSKVASRYYVSTSPTTIANNYIATSNGSNLVARNLFDNNTYAGVIAKPWKFGEFTTASLPTGATGYVLLNTTNGYLQQYKGSAYGSIPTLLDANTWTATQIIQSSSTNPFQVNSASDANNKIVLNPAASRGGFFISRLSDGATNGFGFYRIPGRTDGTGVFNARDNAIIAYDTRSIMQVNLTGVSVEIASSLDAILGNNAASVIFDVRSTTRGSVFAPKMTQAQRSAITPLTGSALYMGVYQTNGTEGVYMNTSAGWKRLLWDGDANTIYAFDGTFGAGRIGTLTDSLRFRFAGADLFRLKSNGVAHLNMPTESNSFVLTSTPSENYNNYRGRVFLVGTTSEGDTTTGSRRNNHDASYFSGMNLVEGGDNTYYDAIAGYGNIVRKNAPQNVIFGVYNTINSLGEVGVYGNFNNVTGQYTTVIGRTNTVSANEALVIGRNNTVSQNNAFIYGTNISGANLNMHGFGTVTPAARLHVKSLSGSPTLLIDGGEIQGTGLGEVNLETSGGALIYADDFETDIYNPEYSEIVAGTTAKVTLDRATELVGITGQVKLNNYGTDLVTSGVTGEYVGRVAGITPNGLVQDFRLARDTFIEDVTLFSVGTMMYDCQELTIVSSMTVLAPSNQEIRFPDASDLLRGKKIIVYSKKKDSGAFIPQIKVVGGVSRLYFTTNPAVGGTDPSDQSTLSIDDSTWSDHGTTFEFTCLKIDNTPSYRWVLKQR